MWRTMMRCVISCPVSLARSPQRVGALPGTCPERHRATWIWNCLSLETIHKQGGNPQLNPAQHKHCREYCWCHRQRICTSRSSAEACCPYAVPTKNSSARKEKPACLNLCQGVSHIQFTGSAAQVQAKVAELHCGGQSGWAEHAEQLTGVPASPWIGAGACYAPVWQSCSQPCRHCVVKA